MPIYDITPVPKPRQTRRDKWEKRPCVMRYRAYADTLRDLNIQLPEHYHVIFILPMPPSWSAKKRNASVGKPILQKPDKDNLEKALLDALLKDDSRVWDGRVSKVWGHTGQLVVQEIEPPDLALLLEGTSAQ